MRVRHQGHTHDVYLCDDGTLDTVIEVDGRVLRYSEAARRRRDGRVKTSWLRGAASEACNADLLPRRRRRLAPQLSLFEAR